MSRTTWISFALMSALALVVYSATGDFHLTGIDNIVHTLKNPHFIEPYPETYHNHNDETLMASGCAYPNCTEKSVGVFRVETTVKHTRGNRWSYFEEDYPLCAMHQECNENNRWPWPAGTRIKQITSVVLGTIFAAAIPTVLIVSVISVFKRLFNLQ